MKRNLVSMVLTGFSFPSFLSNCSPFDSESFNYLSTPTYLGFINTNVGLYIFQSMTGFLSAIFELVVKIL